METEEEKETAEQLFYRALTLLRNFSTITKFQLQVRLAIDSSRAQRLYTKLKEQRIISEEKWEDKPGERKVIGILDKARLKELKQSLMQRR